MASIEEVDKRLTAHEAVCSQLREDMVDFRIDVKNAIRALWRVVLVSAGTLIVSEASLIVTLLWLRN